VRLLSAPLDPPHRAGFSTFPLISPLSTLFLPPQGPMERPKDSRFIFQFSQVFHPFFDLVPGSLLEVETFACLIFFLLFCFLIGRLSPTPQIFFRLVRGFSSSMTPSFSRLFESLFSSSLITGVHLRLGLFSPPILEGAFLAQRPFFFWKSCSTYLEGLGTVPSHPSVCEGFFLLPASPWGLSAFYPFFYGNASLPACLCRLPCPLAFPPCFSALRSTLGHLPTPFGRIFPQSLFRTTCGLRCSLFPPPTVFFSYTGTSSAGGYGRRSPARVGFFIIAPQLCVSLKRRALSSALVRELRFLCGSLKVSSSPTF